MKNDMDKTTGKNYKREPTRKCSACKKVFAVTAEQLKQNLTVRCVFCGSTASEPFQRTTSSIPNGD